MKYYQIYYALDEKTRGRYEMPHTIWIESESFLKYISDKNKTISMYLENREKLYEDMHVNLVGKLLARKHVME